MVVTCRIEYGKPAGVRIVCVVAAVVRRNEFCTDAHRVTRISASVLKAAPI